MLKKLALLSLVSVFALSGCRYFQSEATIAIQALNGEGEALANAKVVVNKVPVGQTDEQGYFKGHLELPVEEPLLIEVSKASTETFYAPYFETIQVKRGDLNNFKLTATLYGLKTPTAEVPPAPSPEATPELSETPETAESLQTLELSATALPGPMPGADETASAEAGQAPESAPEGRAVTFYIVSGRDAVENATVYFGNAIQKQWVRGCYSNSSGRCTLYIPENLDTATVLVRAKGYQTQSRSFSLLDGDKVRFEMARGKSLEVFAINPNQGSMEGVEGITVAVNGRELGTTDRFGSFIAPHTQDPEAESLVSLSAEGWLPSKVEVKRSGLSSDSIIQHFQSIKPLPPKLAVMEFIHFRHPGLGTLLATPSIEGLNEALRSAGGNVINGPALKGKFAEQNLSLDDLGPATFSQVRKVGESIHYILRPLFVDGPEARVILSVIDPHGKMVYSASQSVKAKGVDVPVLRELAQRVIQNIRHEGSIIETAGEEFRINLGRNQGLVVGDRVQITGNARLPNGDITAWDAIASGRITDIQPDRARVKILQTRANARVEAGNSVTLDRKPPTTKNALTVQVLEAATQGPIGLAEIYRGDQWLGYTDASGQVAIPEIETLGSGEITVFSPGFMPKTQAIEGGTKSYAIALDHVPTPVQIESQPEGALVRINGQDLGRTPIDTEIPYPGSTVNIEIGGVDGFELLTRTQSVGARGIVLRGNTQVALERDPLQAARAMAAEGKLVDAAQLLESIPESDPTFLIAQHQLGELFLNSIQDPVKAAKAFHKVTSSPQVENFQDKRFIGTHINEAVALFKAGENSVSTDQNLAISFWRQVEAILSKTEMELRFVPEAQYSQAVHTLNYYRALALHKTWTVTQTGEDYRSALGYWKDYIQGTALSLPQDEHTEWVRKAEGYFRQIQTARKSPGRDPKTPVAM